MEKAKIKDGAYASMVTGAGDPTMDKTASTVAVTRCPERYIELSGMMANDGIAARIASCVPESALRHDIAIVNDADGKEFKECSRTGLIEAFVKAGTYARLYGGAIVVAIYDDGIPFDAPVNDRSKVKGYKVFSSSRVQVDSSMFVTDRNSKYFDEIEFFDVDKPDGRSVRIHASRVTVVRGNDVPDSLSGASDRQLYFGLSEVSKVTQTLKDIGTSMTGIANMLQESDISVFSLTGLNEMLSMPDCGVRKVQERMSVVKLGMSTMRAVFQDSNDKYELISHNYAGIPDILKMMMSVVSSSTSIPVSILFGQTVSGLSQSNEADRSQYDELVERWRSRTLYRPMCASISDLVSRNLGIKGEAEFDFGPVSVMTESEKLEARKKQAETMKMYFDMGVLTPQEIRESVFVNGNSFETSVKE